MFRIILFILFILISQYEYAQNYVFGELTGNPLNTIGWNLTGNAIVGDTPGDADAFSNEIILTNNSTSQYGRVFYNTPINLTFCQKWTVEFEYRITGGNSADGLSFCFIDVPPSGFVIGNGIGIPGTANGLKIVIDTYDNCSQAGTNPEMIPIKKEMVTPNITLDCDRKISIPTESPIAKVSNQINNNPIKPPINERKTDSNKNCMRIK